jgi:hypothetical protein
LQISKAGGGKYRILKNQEEDEEVFQKKKRKKLIQDHEKMKFNDIIFIYFFCNLLLFW